MKNIVSFLLCFGFFISSGNLAAISECKNAAAETHTLAQADLTPLDILILDLRDVKRLIQEGDNKTAIIILKSSLGEARKVKEFDKSTKKTTEKRIKKGIILLKQNKNDEALALVQTGINALIEGGLADASDFV